MGKNLYETPRDKAKWNLNKKTSYVSNDQQSAEEKRKAHIRELKEKFARENKSK